MQFLERYMCFIRIEITVLYLIVAGTNWGFGGRKYNFTGSATCCQIKLHFTIIKFQIDAGNFSYTIQVHVYLNFLVCFRKQVGSSIGYADRQMCYNVFARSPVLFLSRLHALFPNLNVDWHNQPLVSRPKVQISNVLSWDKISYFWTSYFYIVEWR